MVVPIMKSAYELAMERLKVSDPPERIQLTDDQKEELADIDNKYKAKIAAQRISFHQKINQAQSSGDFSAVATLREEWSSALKKLESERESAKNLVRQGKQLRG